MKKLLTALVMLGLAACSKPSPPAQPVAYKVKPLVADDQSPIIIADGSVLLRRAGTTGFARGGTKHHAKGYHSTYKAYYLAYECPDKGEAACQTTPCDAHNVTACKFVDLPQDGSTWLLYAIDEVGKVAAFVSDDDGNIDIGYAADPPATWNPLEIAASAKNLASVTYVVGSTPITKTCKHVVGVKTNCVTIIIKQ